MNDKEMVLNWLDSLARRMQSGLASMPPELFQWRPDAEANSIALTMWHISRAWDVLCVRIIQDKPADQELWYVNGWEGRTGYRPSGKGLGGFGNLAGYTQSEVAQVPQLKCEEMLAYFDQVHRALRGKIEELDGDDWREVKGKWSGLEQPVYDWVSNFIRDGYEHWGEIKAIAAMWKRRARREWMPRERWDALVRGENCPLCAECQSTGPVNKEGYTVATLRLSRLYLNRNQFPAGYCVLICTKHVREPYHLTAEEQALFFGDMWRVAQALERVFNPVKMNFSFLGNLVPHLHAHIKPRFYGDSAPGRPIGPGDPVVLLAPEEYEERVRLIRSALEE